MSRKIQRRSFFTSKRYGVKWLKTIVSVTVALLGIFYGAIFLLPVVPKTTNIVNATDFRIQIKPQSGLASIAEQLQTQGIFVNTFIFQVSAKALFVAAKLKPGTYLLPTDASLGKILLQIARGDRVRESIAIIPGMTIWQLRAIIDRHPALIHQTKGMTTKDLLQSLNLNYPNAEGIFLPDTYIFDPDESDLNIYRRASQAMNKQLLTIWDQRPERLPLQNPYQLLILASIVEKETGRSSDRGMISAVFVNRLNRAMPLQTDPTVIYGIGPKFDGNLRKADLRRDNPYNTYMHKGLPPTPISMPSKESIYASAHPEKSNALYFVAKGDGTSQFSENLNQHEEAVDRYQRKTSANKSNR